MDAQVDEKFEQVALGIERSRKLLCALGDESRQQLIITMMRMGRSGGVRAVEVSERSHLSRPAVSHHLQIMKSAGVLKSRKEGTRVYYYFDPDTGAMRALVEALSLAMELARDFPCEGVDEG